MNSPPTSPHKWKYTDEELPSGVCYDCGTAYPFDAELVIAHDAWEAINPTYHVGAGLLCPNCMIDRLSKKKMCIVEVLHFSVRCDDDDS